MGLLAGAMRRKAGGASLLARVRCISWVEGMVREWLEVLVCGALTLTVW